MSQKTKNNRHDTETILFTTIEPSDTIIMPTGEAVVLRHIVSTPVTMQMQHMQYAVTAEETNTSTGYGTGKHHTFTLLDTHTVDIVKRPSSYRLKKWWDNLWN